MSIKSAILRRPVTPGDIARSLKEKGVNNVNIAFVEIQLGGADVTYYNLAAVISGEGYRYKIGQVNYPWYGTPSEEVVRSETSLLAKVLQAVNVLERNEISVSIQGKPIEEIRQELGMVPRGVERR